MADSNDRFDLHQGDLVLMNCVGFNNEGPLFEVIDKVGELDLMEEDPDGAHKEASPEPVTRIPDTQEISGSPTGAGSNIHLSHLESQRDFLDKLIAQLKQSPEKSTQDQPSAIGRMAVPRESPAPHSAPRVLSRRRELDVQRK